MNVGGIRKIAVYDPVLGTTVQLNNIGVEGDFKSEPMSVETAKGTKSYAGDNFSYNFVSYDESGYDQLKSWMDNQTPVNCVALGIDTHLLWAEDTLITVDMDYKFKVGELNGFSVKLEKKGGELNIFSGVNILKARYGFKDSNADGIADGYSIDAQDAIKSFWGNLQVIEGVETLTVEVYTSVIFPIAGAKLRLHVPSGASLLSWPTKIICKTFAGTVLLSVQVDVNENADITTPTGTYRIVTEIVSNTEIGHTGDLIDFTQPYLGIQEYTGA